VDGENKWGHYVPHIVLRVLGTLRAVATPRSQDSTSLSFWAKHRTLMLPLVRVHQLRLETSVVVAMARWRILPS